MKNFNAHNEVIRVKKLYHQFLKEHNVTNETVYANILWLWPKYLKDNS